MSERKVVLLETDDLMHRQQRGIELQRERLLQLLRSQQSHRRFRPDGQSSQRGQCRNDGMRLSAR